MHLVESAYTATQLLVLSNLPSNKKRTEIGRKISNFIGCAAISRHSSLDSKKTDFCANHNKAKIGNIFAKN